MRLKIQLAVGEKLNQITKHHYYGREISNCFRHVGR